MSLFIFYCCTCIVNPSAGVVLLPEGAIVAGQGLFAAVKGDAADARSEVGRIRRALDRHNAAVGYDEDARFLEIVGKEEIALEADDIAVVGLFVFFLTFRGD